eukprot:CAMPEP_0173142964 /NCGR_PEP_ID=MMETSP1105-20130129/6397_1 /TAXON_ID=2985 /ORGANISM="Ochromonas sp., Strain BG-1" /LENGTH=494 /DNA_ID=CAMNT_0014056447 /DNA_START=285 /DNA_END=1769 /DNA_ORIENTATION=-
MSESCVVEVYENETFNRGKGWLPHTETPYVMKANFAACKPLDEIAVPSSEWQWSTNWKISKMPGVTDSEGWEYASRFSRFKNQNRQPKTEAAWSRARRRLWTRVMRREAIVKNVDIPKITQKVQMGLSSIHAARLKIEEIMKQMPEAAESDQMRSLVTSVNRNIAEILSAIENAEKQCQQNQEQMSMDERNKANTFLSNPNNNKNGAGSDPTTNTIANTPVVLKKLKNDVLKEQAAIERALDPAIAVLNEPPSSGSKTRPHAGSNAGERGIPIRGVSNRGNSFSNGNSVSGSFNQSSMAGNPRAGFGNKGSMSGRPGKSDSITGNPNDRRSFFEGENGRDHGNGDGNPDFSRLNGVKKNEVKSGAAGAFNPSLFMKNSNHNSIKLNENDEVEDGVFVDRSTQDLIISSKLIPIDEVTVMQEIIDERSVEIEKIHKGLVEVNNLFVDLSKLVKEQQVEIDTIYGNVDESHQKTKEAFNHIIEANRLHQQGGCVIS